MRSKTALVVVAVIVIGAMSYGFGLALWQGMAIAAVAGALLMGESLFQRVRASRDQRTRTQLAFEDGRRCKSCNGDLWGLDVMPGKSGAYRVKCPECGVITDFKTGKRSKRSGKSSGKTKPQRAAEDTRSFKIR